MDQTSLSSLGPYHFCDDAVQALATLKVTDKKRRLGKTNQHSLSEEWLPGYIRSAQWFIVKGNRSKFGFLELWYNAEGVTGQEVTLSPLPHKRVHKSFGDQGRHYKHFFQIFSLVKDLSVLLGALHEQGSAMKRWLFYDYEVMWLYRWFRSTELLISSPSSWCFAHCRNDWVWFKPHPNTVTAVKEHFFLEPAKRQTESPAELSVGRVVSFPAHRW